MSDANTARRSGLNELFRHVFAQRGLLVIIVGMSLVSAAIALTQPALIGHVIDRVAGGRALGALPWLLGALVLVGGVLGGVLQYLIQRAAETAIRSSRHRLIDHILRLPIRQMDRRKIGDLVSRVSNDTTTIFNMLSQGLIESVAGLSFPPPYGIPAGMAILEFVNVGFSYDDDTGDGAGDRDDAGGDSAETHRAALIDVSFLVAVGQKVAIVGPSGAGKTTILHLIARFYDADSGRVEFVGHDVASIPRSAVRRKLAYVEQGAPTISGTLRDNLAVGVPDLDDAAILEMLQRLHLSDIIRRTRLGLDAEVGEGGVLLSGGQRQRLALARALLGRPDLLLLDESTSNLDGVNEERARELIDDHAVHCARVVVAHRLSTVIRSDLILVLDAGRIVAQGTHEQLMDGCREYRELAKNQLLATAPASTRVGR